MVSQYKCLECNLEISSKNYAISRHVKKHNISFHDYIRKHYKLVNGNFDTCGFCDKDAIPIFQIEHGKKEYSISYDSGYFCQTQECKNKISLDILGQEYIPKVYEKIGSRSEYLSKLYKININSAKNLKHDSNRTNFFDNSLKSFEEIYGQIEGEIRYKKRIEGITKNTARNKFPCTLENFIKKYGLEIGKKKYNERCEKISYTSSKDFFIEKYGIEKGNEIWKNKYKMTKKSRKSQTIAVVLDTLNIRYQTEKNINSKFVDYYLVDFNIVIEYFGDYWHVNPKVYESNFYISQLKMRAADVWKKDKERLDIIKQNIDSIIVIWESSEFNDSILEKAINSVKNKKTIIYI